MIDSKLLEQEIIQIQDEVLKHRQYLHMHPELDMNLPLTSKYIKEILESYGYKPEPIGESGVLVSLKGDLPGPVFLLRADADALPIEEEANIVEKSLNENMHACGHDFHTAMLLGAAKILMKHQKSIAGVIKMIFQPGEETGFGAKEMIKQKVLENPEVDGAMMIHVSTGIPVPSGRIMLPESGGSYSSLDEFVIEIQGKGGHGAYPDLSVDPITIACHINLGIQNLISKEVSSFNNAVITVGEISAGSSPNIIPDTAMLRGTIRTFDENVRVKLKSRLKEISEGLALLYGGKASLKYTDAVPSVNNDSSLLTEISNGFKEKYNHYVCDMKECLGTSKVMASDDFAFISELVPSIALTLSVGNSNEGYIYPMHHPKAVFDTDQLFKGTLAYVVSALTHNKCLD